MKRLYILAFAVVMLSAPLMGQAPQKTGYVNTETILAAIPEYKVVTERLEALGKQYRAKVEAEYKSIETLYNNYQSQKASLSAGQRQARETEIINKEKAAKQLQQTYFGQDGNMQKKSDELLGPIKDRVQRAIDYVAQQGGYALVIDISALQGVVYADSASDLSSAVIKALNNIK